ncbi:MAG TPA: fumarylacetoacetase [Candidatus Cybelea sp.]|jgi:fumarylacetoacetase|nr:fumarylacetoacetase [Candidatus Cybelea sp.]
MIDSLESTDPRLQSWVPVHAESDFPIQNLPFGVFVGARGVPRIGVAIGEMILDCRAVAERGLLDDCCEPELLEASLLNPLLAAGRTTWRALRTRISDLLRVDGNPRLRDAGAEHFLIARDAVEMLVPMEIGDYVDFYSSLEHATNLGRIFRPNAEALLPNWRWIPIGYHGRSGTIVIDGTPVRRPHGQRKPPDAPAPLFGASGRLDIELEMGFVTGPGNAIGEPIAVSDTAEHIFGLLLVNDWSARDIQAWEYQPLGPFLGKSFATTISPWIVTLDALEPFRVEGPRQDPEPLEYLRVDDRWAYNIQLAVDLQTAGMRASGVPPATISQTNFRDMYWNVAQQLAHATVNGALVRPGDLFASGTISGSAAGTQGSLIELSWNGERPLALPGGETRTFLEDGDEITLRGWCERTGARRIGFGAARGRIEAVR